MARSCVMRDRDGPQETATRKLTFAKNSARKTKHKFKTKTTPHYNTILRDSENVQNDSLTIVDIRAVQFRDRHICLNYALDRAAQSLLGSASDSFGLVELGKFRPSAMCRAAARSLRRTAAPLCATSWLPERLLRLLVLSHKQGQRLLERRLALAWLR